MRKSTRCCLCSLSLSPCALSDCAMYRGWRTSRQLSQGYCFSFSLFHLLQHFPVHPFVRPLQWPSRKPIPAVSCLLSVSLPCVENRTVLQAKLKQLTYFFPKRRRNDRSENNLLVIKTNSNLGYGGGRCRTLLESIDVREKSLEQWFLKSETVCTISSRLHFYRALWDEAQIHLCRAGHLPWPWLQCHWGI